MITHPLVERQEKLRGSSPGNGELSLCTRLCANMHRSLQRCRESMEALKVKQQQQWVDRSALTSARTALIVMTCIGVNIYRSAPWRSRCVNQTLRDCERELVWWYDETCQPQRTVSDRHWLLELNREQSGKWKGERPTSRRQVDRHSMTAYWHMDKTNKNAYWYVYVTGEKMYAFDWSVLITGYIHRFPDVAALHRAVLSNKHTAAILFSRLFNSLHHMYYWFQCLIQAVRPSRHIHRIVNGAEWWMSRV